MGLVRRLVGDLEKDGSVKKIILGGHQVSGHISKYFESHQEKIIVVNGAGEAPFRDALAALAEGNDLTSVSGVSCFVDGELYEGGLGEQLPSPEEIPSPFLEGFFDEFRYPISVFETNRGCPFQCSFCTWGGDTSKVTKFPIDRLKEELRWIAKKNVFFIFLGDANWGMLPRDVELSEYIGRLKSEFGTPWGVYYAAAKNKPKGSLACIKAFHESGVITSQALGIQSLNDETLEAIGRKNIKSSALLQMFGDLKGDGISSYCELIWPLPKETLDSFKRSFEKLLDLNAPTVIAYPAMLINNAKLTADADQYELSTIAAADWKSEIRMVTSTSSASRNDVTQGFWFYYSHFLLGNCDGYKSIFRFAEEVLGLSSSELTSHFSAYLQSTGRTSKYFQFLAEIFEKEEHGDLRTIGALACHLTHECREESQRLVAQFLATEFKIVPSETMAFINLWLITMPLVFRGSKSPIHDIMTSLNIECAPRFGDIASVSDEKDTTVLIRGEEAFRKALRFFGIEHDSVLSKIQVRDEFKGRMPYTTDADRDHVYAHGMIQRLADISPGLTVV
jgi:hypothetical protein